MVQEKHRCATSLGIIIKTCGVLVARGLVAMGIQVAMMLCVAMHALCKLVVMWICVSISMVTSLMPPVLALYSILVAMKPCITMTL